MTPIDPRALTLVTGGTPEAELAQSANRVVECTGAFSKAVHALGDYVDKHYAAKRHFFLNPSRNAAKDAAHGAYQAAHEASDKACAPFLGR